MKSRYCQVTFLLALGLGYALLPKTIFNSQNIYLAIIFVLVFAFNITCVVRTIKEKVVATKKLHTSFLSLVAIVLGFSAFQVCGVAAPVCGISIGAGIVSFIFPGVLFGYLTQYSVVVIVFSILLQLVSLYYMKCFRKTTNYK